MRDGVRLAAEEINKSGGLLGRQIVLIERDDEAKNERGVQIAQELVNKEQVTAVVGYINTGVALASQRFFQEAKIPVMNNVATGSVITHQFDKEPENYVFRNAAHDSIQAPMIVEEAVTRRGFKKVAILADSTNLRPARPRRPREGAQGQGHHAGGGREVQHQGCGHDRPAPQGQGSRRRSRADLRHRPRARADRQRHDQARLEGAHRRSWTLSMANYIDNAGPGGEGARMPQTFIQEPTTPKRQALHHQLPQDLQPEERPHGLAGLRRAGLRLHLPARRRDQAGRLHRRPEGQGRRSKTSRPRSKAS